MPRAFARAQILPPMLLFALATLLPLALLLAGAALGGLWVLAGVVAIGLLTAVLDHLMRITAPDAPEGAEFPAADVLLVVLALCHLAALPLAVWAIAGDSGISAAGRVLLFLGFGQFFGQVSNPAAHELIHRGGKGLFRLGVAIYASLLNGHHVSAHRLVHHRHVATDADPNSARSGEGYYRFLLRAWPGSFRAGLAAETALRAKGRRGLHPYAVYILGAGASLLAGAAIAGWAGLAVWAGLALFATAELYLSDYVQHYGLRRRILADGRPEPVGDRHSWNAPHWASSGLMLNAPRHSDHHAHPSRPYPALRLPEPDQAPWLPYSLPVCSVIALSPPHWRRIMRPHVKKWLPDA